jgi:hypothetical protein
MHCAPQDSRLAPGPCRSPVNARDVLFDLAVNRALLYVRHVAGSAPPRTVEELVLLLEPWALRTRFVARLELPTIARCLHEAPQGRVIWSGGIEGGWHEDVDA